MLFQHVSASCLGVFCLILSISYHPLHHSRCPNCPLPLSGIWTVEYLTLCYVQLVLFAIVYDDDRINYVVTVLRSKLHIEE